MQIVCTEVHLKVINAKITASCLLLSAARTAAYFHMHLCTYVHARTLHNSYSVSYRVVVRLPRRTARLSSRVERHSCINARM